MLIDIDIDHFEKDLWQQNPDGSLRETWDLIVWHVEQYTDAKDNPLTYDTIKKKYMEYLNWFNSRYGKTEERYIPKIDKRKTIHTFVTEEGYKREYNTATSYPERDPYLFGEFKINDLKNKLKIFKSKIEHGKSKS
jgi:hypothetical protein